MPRMRLPALLAAAVLFAACSREPAMDDQMRLDLQAASAGSIELAPAAGSGVVSGVELVPQAKPAVAPVKKTPAPAPRNQQRTTQTVSNPEPAATRPSTTPAVNPPPPGGYKTVGEVIRNAPFPIKP